MSDGQTAFFEGLVACSRDALLATTADGKVLAWNWAAELMYGYAHQEVLGRSILELLVPPGLEGEARAALQEAIETGSAVFETKRRRKDGTLLDVEVFQQAVRDARGHLRFLAVSHRDLGDQKRLAEIIFEQNRALEAAKHAAEAATRAKSEFLATMSHEIRTPMNAIIGMTSLLGDTPLTAEQREFVETIRTSGDHLLTVINDILDFSKIESGKMELEEHPFDLRRCVEEALDLVAPRASEKGLELAYLIDDGTPQTLVGDAGRLRQVLVNLLANAVKFTAQGEVLVSVASRPLEGGKHAVHVAVKDTGIGIPPGRRERLFKPFSQMDAATTRQFGGTGLGLAISKRLCELMGGSIGVESEPGKGSTFSFTIVAEALPVPPRRAVTAFAPEFRGRRLLVVDDNATNRRIVSLYARSWGMLPRDTGDPAQALAWVRKGDPFDVAVLDLAMPEMDGLALARRIRELRTPAQLPMVMLSSLGPRVSEVKASGVAFAATLTKPIKPSTLHDALAQALAGSPFRAAQVRPQAADPGMAAKLPLRILLAEDNALNLKVALRMLERLGYHADVAGNGQEALDALGRQLYDVVLMDVQMPEMDGLEASRRICERWPREARPRIVAMTANALAGDRERCLEAGMDDYISKPVDFAELVAALRRALPGDAPRGEAVHG